MAAESITTFIDAQYLKDNTILNDNVDEKVLLPIIRSAQAKYIQQVIGTQLTNKLIALVDAFQPIIVTPAVGTIGQPGYIPAVTTPGTPIPPDYYNLLVEYIIPVATQYTIYEAIPFLNFKFRNKGIMKQSSDNAQPSELNELMYLRDNVLNTAQFYAQRMSNFLCKNSNLYPEYSECGDIEPIKDNYRRSIFTPKRSCGRRPW